MMPALRGSTVTRQATSTCGAQSSTKPRSIELYSAQGHSRNRAGIKLVDSEALRIASEPPWLEMPALRG